MTNFTVKNSNLLTQDMSVSVCADMLTLSSVFVHLFKSPIVNSTGTSEPSATGNLVPLLDVTN